jgi:hypothetical protein
MTSYVIRYTHSEDSNPIQPTEFQKRVTASLSHMYNMMLSEREISDFVIKPVVYSVEKLDAAIERWLRVVVGKDFVYVEVKDDPESTIIILTIRKSK